LNCGKQQDSGWKWTDEGVEEKSYGQVIVVFVVFEAAFAKVQSGKSAHSERAFFAVVAWSKAPQKF